MNSKLYATTYAGLFLFIVSVAPLGAQPNNLSEFSSYCLSNCESGAHHPKMKELGLCTQYCGCQTKQYSDTKFAELRQKYIRQLIDAKGDPYKNENFALTAASCAHDSIVDQAIDKIKNKKQ